MIETITIYWRALKYWAGGASWDKALAAACKMVMAGWDRRR